MVGKHSKVSALKWNLHLQKAAGKPFGAREVLGAALAPPLRMGRLWRWGASSCSLGSVLQHPLPSSGSEHLLLFCTPQPPQPSDWWFKLGMWSTQMSSSRRSLFSRIISLTTHFSLSLSWLHSRDLPACLVWGLTAATLLDPSGCILFSLTLIRDAIAYSTGLGEEEGSGLWIIYLKQGERSFWNEFLGFLTWVSIKTAVLTCTE